MVLGISFAKMRKSDYNYHSLHKLCSRICSFPVKLPAYFIEKFSSSEDVVFDPFSGKGTCPLEAILRGREAIGNDISPDAFTLTHAKLRPVSKEVAMAKIDELQSRSDSSLEELDNPQVRIFFGNSTLTQILGIRELLKNDNSDAGIFIKAAMLGIIHGDSENSLSLRCSHAFSMSPNYVKKYAKLHKLRRPKRDVYTCLKSKIESVLASPLPEKKGMVLNEDSRKISLADSSVDLIVTSPPYFNVQKYAWDNWLRLWFLGHDYRETRKKLVESSSKTVYADFMRQSFEQMYRVLDSKGKCFVVVGDVVLRRHQYNETINTARFLRIEAEKAGFYVNGIARDVIPPGKKVLYSSIFGKGIKFERTLCLSKN